MVWAPGHILFGPFDFDIGIIIFFKQNHGASEKSRFATVIGCPGEYVLLGHPKKKKSATKGYFGKTRKKL